MPLIQITKDKNPEVFLVSGVCATESPPQAAKDISAAIRRTKNPAVNQQATGAIIKHG